MSAITRPLFRSPSLPLAALLLLLAAILALIAPPARAGGPFAPVAKVNEKVVTGYELDQRARFMQLLRAPGDVRELALKALIDERLQVEAAERMGIEATDEMIAQGMEEFAGRANLTAEKFVQLLRSAGVAEETFRDFVKAGILWREVVRTRFAPRVQVSDAEVDRALAMAANPTGLRVLLSEIILPAPPELAAEAERIARRLARIRSFSAFAAAARQYSASRSRDAGGRLPWMPLSNLPPQIRSQILALKPGEVTQPIPIPGGIALFQLRALEEIDAPAPTKVTVEYMRLKLPGRSGEAARKEAARIEASTDTCEDLYGINKGKPEELLERVTKPMAEVAGDEAIALAKLDPNEISPPLPREGGSVLLMLCARIPELPAEISREEIRNRLANQALAQYAEGFLAELRADAHIEMLGQ